MRVVRGVHAGRDREASPSWLVPRPSVSDLAARFPEARLVPLNVARTPGLDAGADEREGVRVWLALESLQVTGSFKVRGALVALAEARAQRGDGVHVIAASAGNHGCGVAYAAKVLGVRASIVLPQAAPEVKRRRIAGYGAALIEATSPHYDDAEAAALKLAQDTGAIFVSPYDDPFVAAGNGGSLGYDIARALGRAPDVVVCPVGGGGLASGLAWAFDGVTADTGGRRTSLWGIQSEACPAMAESLARDSAVTRMESPGETLAEGLEGGVSETGFARARASMSGIFVADEDAIAAAIRFAFRELGLVLEGSAATALVPILSGFPRDILDAMPPCSTASSGQSRKLDVVVVLTGRNIDSERLLRLTHDGG